MVRRQLTAVPKAVTSRRTCGSGFPVPEVQWLVIAKGGPAPTLSAKIVGIDISGTAGNARVEISDWRGTRYTDFFLLCNAGSWRITSKVFFAHSRA